MSVKTNDETMAQYIDKDALVAEIERRMKCYDRHGCEPNDGKWVELISIKHFLDTLEVKEVDLEKESELIANGIMISVQANRYHTNVYNTKSRDFVYSDLQRAAKRGIELGLKSKQ